MKYLSNEHYQLKHIIVIPIVTTLIIPLVILDIWAEVYHRICFPFYGYPYIRRSVYIKIDRHKLKYLTFWQKMYCVYCGYGNGVIAFWREMVAQTEKYWCGIRHKADKGFIEPEHHRTMNFAEYGNEKDFEDKYLK
ncbi:MAG: hypothetical protein V1846_00465 [Candidatus Komeilibacteria bacterium]